MNFILSPRGYEILKWTASIAMPALMTFYFTIGQIWHLPLTEEVVGTMAALNLALGSVLGISTANYRATLNK